MFVLLLYSGYTLYNLCHKCFIYILFLMEGKVLTNVSVFYNTEMTLAQSFLTSKKSYGQNIIGSMC